MNKAIKLNDENKKRAAFKRFSQMSATGIAVISLSAFTNVSAQQLPDKVEKDTLTETNYPFPDIVTPDSLMTRDIYINGVPYGDYNNYCRYINTYSNQYGNTYGNYSNTYGNYTNNYSNYTNNN
jgi:hypothetical protein